MGNEAFENIEISDEESKEFLARVDEPMAKKVGSSEELTEGKIAKIEQEFAFIDINAKSEIRLNIAEITGSNGELLFNVGDKLPVLIWRRPGEGLRVSHTKAVKKQKVKEFIAAYKARAVDEPMDIVGSVTGKNKGGYIVESGGVEFFMPISLAAFREDAKPVGKSVTARVIKIDEEANNLVVSRRSYLNAQRKVRRESVKKLTEAGDILPAIVKRIQNYGMFVESMGVEGLVHYTEISHKGPVNPALLYKEGDEVLVKVSGSDKDKNRISFSIKATQPNPWQEIAEQLEVGSAIIVTVANMENYGAFVDLGNDTEGFLHISEISWNKDLKHPSEVLTIGQEIEVEVIGLDVEQQRLRVSLKKLQPKPFELFAKNHKIGDILKGEITALKEFGAFVKVDGVEGLLHNEDCSWKRTEGAKELFKVGDEVDVAIIKIDTDASRLSFSRKALAESPIEIFAKSHAVGNDVDGTVRDIQDFGVFVRIEEGVDALIRTEDLPPLNPEEIKVGDHISATIVGMDPKKGRIRLSVRRLEKQKERDVIKNINKDDRMTLGDAIKGTFGKKQAV